MHNISLSFVLAAVLGIALPARAELVVIVNPKAPVASMTKDEVAQYFLGKSSALVPIDQPESAPIRSEFYKKVADKDLSQAKALWSKLIFTGKATLPQEVGNSDDVKKAVATNPKAIGYIDRTAVDATVKVIYTAP
jgi:ABC-type phosphate transport system substrate-binding protein